ncbi:protein of unknown function [Methanoculleus bourgensis]|uniref:Uncharacterized protein n=1 Tax=Methanoculleus bourgensis TaxID=83986 RepID=A0A0X3BKY9_9EURY|nr:protein of unknown function [Methanoculleus bourgensis]
MPGRGHGSDQRSLKRPPVTGIATLCGCAHPSHLDVCCPGQNPSRGIRFVHQRHERAIAAEKGYQSAAVPQIPVSSTPLFFAVNVLVRLNPKKLLLTRFSLRNVRARMFPEEMLAPVARSTPAFNRPREHERGSSHSSARTDRRRS